MSTAAGLGQALGLGLERGVTTGLQQVLTNFQNQQKRQSEIDKLSAQEEKKFLSNIEKDIDTSLKFQQIDPFLGVEPEDKSKFKKDAIKEFIETGDPNAVSNVIERWNLKRLEEKAEKEPTSLASRIFGRGVPTTAVQPTLQPSIEAAGQPPTEEVPGIPFGRRGPPIGGEGPNIIDLFKEEGLIPEERKEIAGVPIEQIPSHLLPFLTQTEMVRTEEARKQIEEPLKSYVAGITFGLSENIPGFKVEKPTSKLGKVNNVLARLFGGFQTVGALEKYAIGPVGARAGAAVTAKAQSGKILKGLATQIATKAVIRGTGSAGINFLNSFIQNDEPTNLKDIVKHGLTISGIGAAFDTLGDAAIPLVKSLNNIARKEGVSNWEIYKQFGNAIKNRGFSFFKGVKPTNTATPTKILEIGEDFTSVKSLPTLIQDNIQSKAKLFKTKPEEIAKTARKEAANAGIDIDEVEQGDPQAVQGFNRIVTDLYKEEITSIDRKALTEPGIFTDPELAETAKNAIGTRENAALLEEEFSAKVFDAQDEIKAQGGESKASTKSILKRKDAFDAVKFIRKIKKDLPFEKEIAKKEIPQKVQKIVKVAKEVEKPEIRREKLIEREKEERVLVRKAAKSPVEAFSESIPAIEKPTKAQIFDQITTSFDKIKSEIRKPELVDVKKVERRTENDKRAIQKANDILKRGELLSNVEQDTFLKIKKQYADAYKDMIDFNKEFIEDNKEAPQARLIRAVKEAEIMNKELAKRLKRAEADITLQKNKRAIQKLSKGSKGSFFRNQLKRLRSDIENLQKDIFKQNRLKSQLELKVERVSQEAKETMKLFNDLMKNPTSSKAQKVADAVGIDNKKINEEAKKFVNEAVDEEFSEKEIKEKLEEIRRKTEEKAQQEKAQQEKETKKKERKKPKTKEEKEAQTKKTQERKRGFRNGLLYSAIKIFLKEKFGVTLPSRGAGRFLGPAAATIVGASTAIVTGIKQGIKLNRIRKFKKARGNITAIQDLTKKLRRKGLSTTQIKNLQKRAAL